MKGTEGAKGRRISGDIHKNLFDNAASAIFIADARTGRLTDCNRAATRLVGMGRKEIIGMHQSKLHPPGKARKYRKMFKGAAGKREGLYADSEVITKKGRIIPVSISSKTMEIGGRKVIEGIFNDITERKKTEEKLRESEEKYRKIFEISPEIIVLLDRKGTLLDINDRIHNLLGYRAEELIGKNIFRSSIIPAKSKVIILGKFTERMLGKNVPPYDVEFKTKDGKTVFGRIFANPLRDKNGDIIGDIAVISDVTEMRKAEKELRKRAEELERFNKLAVGRELKMVEMKKRVKELESELKRGGRKE